MKNRSVVGVILLTVLTCGIYAFVWAVCTKREMNEQGADIPTAWWIIVPFANIWWMWKYCEGVAKVTSASLTGPVCFLFFLVHAVIGMAVVQNEFNQVVAPPVLPRARVI